MLDWLRPASRALRKTRAAGLLELPPIAQLRKRATPGAGVPDVLEALETLEEAGISVWVAGGWGVDALLGRQTRKHLDLDLVVDSGDAAAAIRALAAIGYSHQDLYEHLPDALLPDRCLLLSADGRSVDLHPVDVATWCSPAGDASPFVTGTIGSRPTPCLAPAVQRIGHRGYPPRDLDRHDLKVLDDLELQR